MTQQKYEITQWQYWYEAIAGQLTSTEWFIIGVALLASWVFTEFVKRNIVRKSGKVKKGLDFKIPLFGSGYYLRIRAAQLISFVVAGSICLVFWPSIGMVGGTVKISTTAGIVGILSPVAHQIVMFFLRKFGMGGLANIIEGNSRVHNFGPPEGSQERRL